MMPIDPNRGYIGGASCIEPSPGFHNRHHTMDIVVPPDRTAELFSKGNATMGRAIAEKPTSSSSHNTSSNSGCFIATAAYGSPYNERIDVLRCWRDVRLRQSRLTAPLVRWYYAISPPIARCVARSKTLRFLVRAALRPTIWLISIQVKDRYQDWEDDRSLPRAVDYNKTNSNNKNMEGYK